MAQATFSVRMDENLKGEFEALCNEFGMNMSTAINVFARAVVRERKIPFEITSSSDVTRQSVMSAFNSIRKTAKKSNVSDMSMDDIDAEIKKARYGD